MKKAILLDLICAFLLLLFLYTALSKLFDYRSFSTVLHQLPLLEQAAPLVAWVLPIGEIGLSLLLLFSKTRLRGLYISLLTLAGFTAYLSYMITVGTHLPCSCGGVLKQLSWRQHLVFNGVCIGLAVTGILLHHSIEKDRVIRPGYPPRPIL